MYEPTRSTRFYPGANLSRERKEKILSFGISLDEATFEDILFNTARAYTGTFYSLVSIVEERFGEEVARDVVREMAYRSGLRNIRLWLQAHNATSGTPSLMCAFQDYAHAMRGPDHARAVAEYNDSECRVWRASCGWHTGRPEGAQSYCQFASEGFLKAYREGDPGLRSAELQACMSKGDDHCTHVFLYGEDEGSSRQA